METSRNVGCFSQAGVSVTLFGEVAQTRGLLRHETVEPPLNGYMFPCFKPLYNGPTTLQQSRSSLPKAAILDQEVQLSVYTFFYF